MLAVIASGFAISSALRPRCEEENGHLEVLLATALPRARRLAGHVALTVARAAAVPGDEEVARTEAEPGCHQHQRRARTSPGRAQYAAAVPVPSGVARLLFGVLPRWMVLAWAPLALPKVVMLFGDLFRPTQWLQDASPFEHVPMVPAEDFSSPPVLALAGLAVLLSVAGQLGFQRRDVH